MRKEYVRSKFYIVLIVLLFFTDFQSATATENKETTFAPKIDNAVSSEAISLKTTLDSFSQKLEAL